MPKDKKKSVGKEICKRLEEFAKALEKGEKFKITRVKIIRVPSKPPKMKWTAR